MALTDTQIRKLKPSDKCTSNRPDKYSDGSGLQLWVRHTGNKVWISAYRYHDKQQSLTLGKYPTLGLADARLKNAEIKDLLANGLDPKQQKQANKVKQNGSKLFATIADSWYKDRQAYLAPNTFNRNHSAYLRDIKPFIGNKLLDDITALDVLAIGRAVEERGANEMARRTMREIGQIFKHAIRNGLTTNNPANNLSEAIKPHKTQHHSRIAIEELPALLRHIDNYQGDLLIRLGLKLFAYTFVRTSELRFMEWGEIDYQASLWRIPAEKMKAKRPHIVPLAPQVLAILEQIKSLNLSDKYIFFNTSTRKPYSQNAFITALWRMGYKGRMTGHGFRGLASTCMRR